MKKRVYISAFVFIVALLGLFLPALAEASLPYQLIHDTELHYSGNPIWAQQSLGTGLTGDFRYLNLYLKRPNIDEPLNVKICEADANSDFYASGQTLCPVDLTDYVPLTATSTEATILTYDLGEDLSFNPAKYYMIQLFGSVSANYIYGSANDDDYSNGGGYISTFGKFQYIINVPQYFHTETEPIYDIYFSFSMPDSISFVFPTEATSTPDFSYWHIANNYADFLEADENRVAIKYSQNDLADCGSYTQYTSYEGVPCYRDEVLGFESESNYGFFKLYALTAGVYNAEADLITNGEILASSTISFTITGQPYIDTYLYGAPTSTWATSTLPFQITCDPNDNLFQYSLCNLAQYLFVPSQQSISQYSLLGDMIKSKAPIGYFYLVQTAFNSLSTSTAAFTLGDMGAVSDYIFTPFRTGLTFILWLMFCVWVFNRIRHLEL